MLGMYLLHHLTSLKAIIKFHAIVAGCLEHVRLALGQMLYVHACQLNKADILMTVTHVSSCISGTFKQDWLSLCQKAKRKTQWQQGAF